MSAIDNKANKVFPSIDYKKIKVINPEHKAKFPAINLLSYFLMVITLAIAIAALSAYIKDKKAPEAEDFQPWRNKKFQPEAVYKPAPQHDQKGFLLKY